MNNDHIGVIRESSLHASIKTWYAQPGDLIEKPVEGYLIDLVRGKLLIEIQVRNFSSIKNKLKKLLTEHNVKVVHPIAEVKWIVRLDPKSNNLMGKRKSPQRGRLEDLFSELIYIPQLVQHPRFSLDVVLIHKEEIRTNDGKGSWRRKGWSIIDHKLLDIKDCVTFSCVGDYLGLLPANIPEQFTTKDLAKTSRISRRIAQKMVYSLHKMGGLELIGKKGRSHLYKKSANYPMGN
jgi:hypothetical protein